MRSLKNPVPVLMLCLAGIYISSCKPSVKEELVVQFSMNKRIASVGDSIRFNNESKNYTSVYWDFGDGSSSKEISPSHAYDSEGTFYPVIKATKDEESKELSLKIVIVPPHNKIVLSDSIVLAGQEILFSTTEKEVVVWKINDAVISESESLKRSFQDQGVYKLEIFNQSGKILLDKRSITVNTETSAQTAGALKPVTITIWPPTAYVDDKITYSTNAVQPIVWDFAGETSEETKGEVFFDRPGQHTITLSDKATGELLKTKTITILEKLDDIKFSSWLSDLANNKLSRNEKKELSKKVYSYCQNNGDIPITGSDISSGLFKDFVIDLQIKANPYELVTINANFQLNSNKKISGVQLVTYNKKDINN
jgi:PKD repeat protein